MIKKVNGYKATTKRGRHLSKRPKTRREAIRQLYAVEKSMKRRGAH